MLVRWAEATGRRRGWSMRKTVSLAGSFYFGGKYRKNSWIRENGASILSE
jgi:hypothetical protein